MSADRLIDDLVAGLRPARSRTGRRDALILGLVGAIEIGLFLAAGAARPDMGAAMAHPAFWWKLASLGLLTAVGVATALRSFAPTGSPRPGLRIAAALIGATLVAGWAIDAAGGGRGSLASRLMWRDGVDCIVVMAILSVPAIVALGLLMRRGAATDRPGSALAVGVAAAAWGGFVFVLGCPHDDPFYVVVWYGLGCSIVALIARLLLPRLTRW